MGDQVSRFWVRFFCLWLILLSIPWLEIERNIKTEVYSDVPVDASYPDIGHPDDRIYRTKAPKKGLTSRSKSVS